MLAAAFALRNQQLAELIGRHRIAEQVSLSVVAAVLAQERELSLVLDAFGDDLELEAVTHLNDRIDDRGVVAIDGHVAHERLIDLERADRELLKRAQR